MKLPLPVVIGIITGLVTITGSYFTAAATSDSRANEIDTKVQLVQNTQSLQYTEVKAAIQDLKDAQKDSNVKLDQILRAVK